MLATIVTPPPAASHHSPWRCSQRRGSVRCDRFAAAAVDLCYELPSPRHAVFCLSGQRRHRSLSSAIAPSYPPSAVSGSSRKRFFFYPVPGISFPLLLVCFLHKLLLHSGSWGWLVYRVEPVQVTSSLCSATLKGNKKNKNLLHCLQSFSVIQVTSR